MGHFRVWKKLSKQFLMIAVVGNLMSIRKTSLSLLYITGCIGQYVILAQYGITCT